MLGRVVYLVAALLLLVALVGLRRADRAVAHHAVTLPGGVPAVAWEPGPPRPFGVPPRADERLPVVVLAHGLSGNKGMMASLARRLAHAGYAVVTLDLRGHGANRTRFTRALGEVGDGLLDDLDAAVLWARTRPHYDAERIVVAGHSLGAGVALEFAAHEPDVAAVVALSGGRAPVGPYPPPNVLLIWAERDPAFIRQALREAGASLTGLERLIVERTYGEPSRGTGVRLTEVDGTDHLTILYSQEAARRILDWLALTVGPPQAGARGSLPGRGGWVVLGLVALLTLLWGSPVLLGVLLPHVPYTELERPWLRLGLHAAALVAAAGLLVGGDPLVGHDALRPLPLLGGRELIGLVLLAGALLSAGLAARGQLGAGLASLRALASAGLIAGFGYVALGSLLSPLAETFLAAHRAGWALTCALLVLPFFASTEWLLRGPGRLGVALPALGKLLTLGVILAAAGLGLLSPLVLLGAGPVAASLLLFEVVAYRLSRAAPNPWVAALVQSLWAGWLLATLFPLE